VKHLSEKSDTTDTSRRSVLRGLAASGTLAVGGIGVAAADHGEQGGNRRGGEDHGNGKSGERGGEGGQGGGGGGPSRVTGGSALTFGCSPSYTGGEIVEIDSKGTDTKTYWSGCEAAKEATAPANKTYEQYNVFNPDALR